MYFAAFRDVFIHETVFVVKAQRCGELVASCHTHKTGLRKTCIVLRVWIWMLWQVEVFHSSRLFGWFGFIMLWIETFPSVILELISKYIFHIFAAQNRLRRPFCRSESGRRIVPPAVAILSEQHNRHQHSAGSNGCRQSLPPGVQFQCDRVRWAACVAHHRSASDRWLYQSVREE